MKREDFVALMDTRETMPRTAALPRTDGDRLAFLDAYEVYVQFDQGSFKDYYITRTEHGWEVGKPGNYRMEATFRDAIDAIYEGRYLEHPTRDFPKGS